LPGFETNEPKPTITIGGKPWNGCPGSLASTIKVAQVRRIVWHTEGRLGSEVSNANPRILDALEAYVSGQMAAQASQHKSEMERLKNG
tara:strand:- start:9661 stop:9924 length:264 start_codon:yes stop_codon:yes gene_type:complete